MGPKWSAELHLTVPIYSAQRCQLPEHEGPCRGVAPRVGLTVPEVAIWATSEVVLCALRGRWLAYHNCAISRHEVR